MIAPPFRLFIIILFRKKKGHALVRVVHFLLFFGFSFRNTLLHCLLIRGQEKIILTNSVGPVRPVGAKVFFFPLTTA